MAELRRLLRAFPQPMDAAFAYGSAVFRQSHSQQRDGMVDLVFAVPCPRDWHRANLQRHAGHYSCLGRLGPAAVARVQAAGAGVYFNTVVPIGDRLVKYGVVSTTALLQDLLHWRWLYLAGRLHKPVAWLQPPESEALRSALHKNLVAALAAGLLLLPARHSERELLSAICGVSYDGDVRMAFGEDRGKVQNIVLPQARLLRDLYRPLAGAELAGVVDWTEAGQLAWDADCERARRALIGRLPRELANRLRAEPADAERLRRALRGVVFSSSLVQTAKSAATAGFAKAVRYGARKIGKWAASLRR